MPKISVVIPCRDRQKIIAETLTSVINQTVEDWELVVVDDHSNSQDQTESIIKSFNDSRIKYYKLPDENGMGVAAARNFGNIMATSPYIAVADSDDINYPKRLAALLEAFENQEADVVYSDLDVFVEDTGEIKKRPENVAPRQFDPNYFKKIDYIPNPTVGYRRKLALDYPYNSFFRMAEDYDMLSRLYINGYKFFYIDEPLVRYRLHSESLSRDRSKLFYYKGIVQDNRGWERHVDGN